MDADAEREAAMNADAQRRALAADVERARRVEPSWDELRERRVLARVVAERERSVRSSRRARATMIGAGVAAIAAAALLSWMRPGASEPTPPDSIATGDVDGEPDVARPARLALRDGSEVFLTADAQVEIEAQEPARVRIVQRAGEARYVVSHRPERSFVVVVDDVEVRVRGTRFVVRRGEADVEVAVEQGRVEVARGDDSSVLGAGDSLRVRTREDHAAPDDQPTDAVEPALPSEPVEVVVERSETSRARSPRVPVAIVEPPGIEARLAEADAARRAGRLDEAAHALRAAVTTHAGDPRVATALFTLGRVERARGRDAAAGDAFERSYAQAPHGALAEDALAEAAVSWSAAGRQERARGAARRYLDLHPTGLYVARVRHLAE